MEMDKEEKMIKVFQTRYGKDEGNCYQACLASILELELDEVPDFCNLYKESSNAWQVEANKWLRQFGLATITVICDLSDGDFSEHLKDCFVMAGGKNQNGVGHHVIYKNGKVVHNPNKNCKGIKQECIDIVFPCNPKLRKKKRKNDSNS